MHKLKAILTACAAVTVAAASCALPATKAPRQSTADQTAVSIVTDTPIVVDIIVPTSPDITGAVTAVSPTRTSAPPIVKPRPAGTATAQPRSSVIPATAVVPTVTLQPVTGQTVRMTPIPTDATTGLTPTDMLTDTAVPTAAVPIQLPPGTINIALLGVDTRPQKFMANTDVIIIASINPDVPAVTMLSIPRDTLVYIPGWRSHKVNTAFGHGGPDLFKQTIKYNFGINVDYYVMVNFTSVVAAVETLDGVDVVATCPLKHVFPKDPYYLADETTPLTVTQLYTDTFTGEVWQPGIAVPTQTIDIPYPGIYHLNGLEALAYVRARYNVPGGDIDRGRREQKLVRALLVKAKQIEVIPRIPRLLARFQKDLKTDLTLDDILYFAGMAGRFNDAIIRSRYLDPGSLKSAMLPQVGAVLIMDREKMPEYIQQVLTVALNQRPNEGIPIEVWNGTGNRDWGIVAADRLSEMGFVIADVQQADKYYPRTTIVDFTTTKKGSAVPLLQRTFNIKDENIVSQPTKDGPRYRIIVGPDFNPCYYQNRGPVPTATPVVTATPTP